MDAKLIFQNESNDPATSKVVLLQKNISKNAQTTPVAWKVFQNVGIGDRHPFSFSTELSLGVADQYGTQLTAPISIKYGSRYAVIEGAAGIELVYNGLSAEKESVELINSLERIVNAEIYVQGQLLAIKPSILRTKVTTFRFDQTIWIGTVPRAYQGEVLKDSVLAQIHTKFDLTGIKSAEILMIGGGKGKNAQPFAFELRNVTPA